MSVSAPQIQFRTETIATFEIGASILRDTVTTEAVTKGNQAKFLVSGTGGASAVTRGVNGKIPARQNDNTQNTATLVEWHDKVEETSFNIFASQGDQRAIMQQGVVKVMNRQINDDIITLLNTGTVNTGAAAVGSLAMVLKSKTKLQNASVPWDNRVTALITPAMDSYLEGIDAYSNADYVDIKPNEMPNAWSDRPQVRRWKGVTWIVYPDLPGNGTNAEKCFMYHESAIGHATNIGGMTTAIGYNEEDDYSFSRATCFMGGVKLQNSGIVVMNHDGSAYA
ncbi:phage capsid protein [Profundibacter sp.]